MKHSTINQSVISSFDNAQIVENLTVQYESIEKLAYWRFFEATKRKETAQLISSGQEKNPQVFNYYQPKTAEGDIATERTHIFSENKNVKVVTYFEDNKEWSCLNVYESTPEGIYHANIFIPSGNFEKHGDISVSIEFCSDEEVRERVNKTGFLVGIKSNEMMTLMKTQMDYMSEEEIEKFVSQVCHIGIKNLHLQLMALEESRQNTAIESQGKKR